MMNDNFLKLLQALDPLFPIGAFTLSNGLETYVQKEIVHDKKSLSEYLNAYIYTLPTNELGFAAKASQGENFVMLDGICTAARSPAELRNGNRKLCGRFLKTELALGDYPLLRAYSDRILEGECYGCHSIAVGLFIADLGTDIYDSLSAYCYSLLSAAVNHAVKLVPLSQLDGQTALSEIMEKVEDSVNSALTADIDELGICGAGFDLRSMQHEKLYTRIYIS